MTAFYNEIDPFAAQWLRNLIAADHIAPGVVDERSIEDINPEELRGFTQCHFFAGIGVWSYALRRAGWPDDQHVWTGSCPCQPFSTAGKGAGFADERHLWPAFHHLIGSVRPPVVFGEQVASKDGRTWLSLVHADVEALGYSFGASDLCAAGLGAPHIRQRLYWVAQSDEGQRGSWGHGSREAQGSHAEPSGRSEAGLLAHHHHQGLEVGGVKSAWTERPPSERGGEVGELGNPADQPRQRNAGGFSGEETEEHGEGFPIDGGMPVGPGDAGSGVVRPWSSCDWIPCRDGKSRPVEPGTLPLAHGAPARVGRLRAYGNAIVPQVAEAFIRSYLEAVMLKDLLS